MDAYRQAYSSLNKQQKAAVDTIEGPVLVLAGPGTGKTQLLTTRVAHILASSDCEPQNILCLTFTESAAFEMRNRLIAMIGDSAYNVAISTYHGFGNDLIARYPEYFMHLYDFKPADELTTHLLIAEIIKKLPFYNELKKATSYVKDVLSLISDLKKANISPKELKSIATNNLEAINALADITKPTLQEIKRIDKKCLPKFRKLLDQTKLLDLPKPSKKSTPLHDDWNQSLDSALAECESNNNTKAITAWKNKWLVKDSDNNFIPDGELQNTKLIDFSELYSRYEQSLQINKLYDYDDMILESLKALKKNPDLKNTLQEKYMYILLDEFQDTNASQLELISQLSDSPVHEGMPNVLAVGDDDQGIYAFQGADHSNMLTFTKMYKNVALVNLTSNYRSHEKIIHFAHGISGQIEERLHHSLSNISKQLYAEINYKNISSPVQRHEFISDIGQYGWVAKEIQKLIKQGISPSEIAVLAPKHKYLEPLMPYLANAEVPVMYEKRENILDDQHIIALAKMAELIIALSDKHFKIADSLWPEILSYDFWNISTETIWRLCWQANDTKQSLSHIIFDSNSSLKNIGLFFMTLANKCNTVSLEYMLDYIVGVKSVKIAENQEYQSPFYEYFFGGSKIKEPSRYWDLLSNLTILRQKLRDHNNSYQQILYVSDFIEFINAHKLADIKVLNTNPYNEATEAIQVMTAYKSKGLEFDHVFLIGCNDQVWGSSSKKQTNKIALAKNLAYIRYQGSSDDERLRLFYVASTRAKHCLYLLSYVNDFTSKRQTPLQYLAEHTSDTGDTISPLIEEGHVVHKNELAVPDLDNLAQYWTTKHSNSKTITPLKAILKQRLDHYQLSPTHLNSFTDIINSGPEAFFVNTILRFPKAPSIPTEYGDAIHKIIEWIGKSTNESGTVPSEQTIYEKYEDILQRKLIPREEYNNYYEKGINTIQAYLRKHHNNLIKNNILYEQNFKDEGVIVGKAHLSGKIDKLIVDDESKTITIVDYKTGKIFDKWKEGEAVLHKYKQQLYCYKLLVEGSNKYKNYTVKDAYLEFMQPTKTGELTELHITFNEDEMKNIKKLIRAMWKNVQELNFPDIEQYPKTIKGIIEFEKYLTNK